MSTWCFGASPSTHEYLVFWSKYSKVLGVLEQVFKVLMSTWCSGSRQSIHEYLVFGSKYSQVFMNTHKYSQVLGVLEQVIKGTHEYIGVLEQVLKNTPEVLTSTCCVELTAAVGPWKMLVLFLSKIQMM